MRESRGQTELLTFGHFVPLAENHFALAAVRRMADAVVTGGAVGTSDLLSIHGPPGTGKTHLASALVDDVCRRAPRCSAAVLAAGDCAMPDGIPQIVCSTDLPSLEAARDVDLLVLEDLQHLPRQAAPSLTQVLNHRAAHQLQTVVTALPAPAQLTDLGGRLQSRLTGGLVVRLESLSVAARRALLNDKAQRRQRAIRPEVLAWLAEHLTGGVRALIGALERLETLTRARPLPLDVADVADCFHEQTEAGRPTVERIVGRVGSYFHVNARQMQSRQRYANVLLPRQVGMYLARQLTPMSLDEIGAYFGGRDHSTVLHACRKVELALVHDPILCGAVRQLQGDLC
jgi:chromosomal replication initiator protein